MTKFQELVDDSINKESLNQIYGGRDGDDPNDKDEHACEEQACSNQIENLKDFCNNGICEQHAG